MGENSGATCWMNPRAQVASPCQKAWAGGIPLVAVAQKCPETWMGQNRDDDRKADAKNSYELAIGARVNAVN